MTDFVTLDADDLGVDRIATSPTAFALYENLFAFTEKASGAPQLANDYIVSAMIAAQQVTQAKLGNSSVGQSQLKGTSGEVSTTAASTLLTLPGGLYGFYPQIRANAASSNNASATIGGAAGGSQSGITWGSTYLTRIELSANGFTSFAQQVYVQASPPYDLGDGQVHGFIFALVDSGGNVIATYAADDPPWANNGPTDIRAHGYNADGSAYQMRRGTKIKRSDLRSSPDLIKQYMAELSAAAPKKVKLTQAMKNADMELIPHPFIGNDMSGRTVVLLDACSDMVAELAALKSSGESIGDLLHSEYIKISNEKLDRSGPAGVMCVSPSWRQSK